MAYQTGTPTSPIDLIQQINTFLAANGWTSDKSVSVGTGWETHLHKGSVYAHLRAAVGEGPWASQADAGGTGLMLYLSDGFDNSADWNLQPTNPPLANGTSNRIGVGMNLSAGPFSNYYFFTDSTNDNFVCILEKTPGLYEYLAWGTSLKKNGTWTGGPYFLGSLSGYYAGYRFFGANTAGATSTSDCPGCLNDSQSCAMAFVRCDSDSFTGKWIPISDVGSGAQGYTGRNGTSSVYGRVSVSTSVPTYARSGPTGNLGFQWMQTSVLDGRANLLPVLWWVGRDGSSGSTGGFSLVGSLPTIFFSNGVGNGFLPASDYVIGPDTYKVFPNFAVLKV